ncbi:TerB family tellurite resistance protein [Zavarzinia compransoris]|uniref:Molecular chaperone DjlA n=1 Tax=Zavarzinia compransoris TaxID=1264899 RepID=A0A317E174_9PROT|nr:TerB family tellurite resistance protein [Zavarzinia compransoris]PWR19113.1 molecular chaperone DjlA [Zavarzinia compransoris]TDP49123.1 DnaJ like chaperone protein [Zavarzinia compransoris]
MAIWGKIIGSAAGFALGGPIGALLGGLAGHAVDTIAEAGQAVPRRDGDANAQTRRVAFVVGVIVLGAKMAKADGRVTQDEIRAFREVFHVPESEISHVARIFDKAKEDAAGFEPYAAQIKAVMGDDMVVLEELLDGLFHIAKADAVIHQAEITFIEDVAHIFGFSEAAFASIRAAHLGPDRSDPYTVLGVSRDMEVAALKAAYRKLVREHHPDLLVAKGMPEEFIAVATERLARINAAWDRIARERGLT